MNPCQPLLKNREDLDEAYSQTTWQCEPLMIYADQTEVNTVIAWKENTLCNGTWTMVSSNDGLCDEESLLPKPQLTDFLSRIESNAIIFRSPRYHPENKETEEQVRIQAYRLTLLFLEKGVEAKKIRGCDHSLFKSHILQPDIMYFFDENRSFSLITEDAHATSGTIGKCWRAFTRIIASSFTWFFATVENNERKR